MDKIKRINTSKVVVAVPAEELYKLEQCRVDLYDFLGRILTDNQIAQFSFRTQQIWNVANTKNWDKHVN